MTVQVIITLQDNKIFYPPLEGCHLWCKAKVEIE